MGSRVWSQQLWRSGVVALWHVESSRTKDQTCVPCIGRQIFYSLDCQGSPLVAYFIPNTSWLSIPYSYLAHRPPPHSLSALVTTTLFLVFVSLLLFVIFTSLLGILHSTYYISDIIQYLSFFLYRLVSLGA